MKLVHHKQRHGQRGKGLQIAISQAEITADLHYPAGSRKARQAGTHAPRSGSR